MSCGNDKNDSSSDVTEQVGGEGGEGGEGGGDGAVMSPSEQKAYLEKVAREFMAVVKSDDFKEMGALVKYVKDTYLEDYDWDDVESWAQDCLDAVSKQIGVDTKTTEYSGYNYYNYYNTITTNFESILLASNFCSRFTASNGKWVRSDADKLEFVFTDQNRQTCSLKLETSGKVVKVHAAYIKNYTGYKYESKQNGNYNTYISNSYYDAYDCTIGVPEHIVVTLTQGNNVVVESKVDINLSNIVGEEFNLSRSNLTAKCVTTLNNGYTFNVSQVAYTANSKASVSFAMTKGDQSLVTIAVAGDVSGIPSCNVSAFTRDEVDEDDFNNATMTNGLVKVDIIGKFQMQGTIKNARQFYDYLQDASNNDKNEANFRSFINQANSLADVNVFYDGNSTKQASVKMEVFSNQNWRGEIRWETEPVLCFYDGSSYSTFEAFFNDKDFKGLIDSFKNYAQNYASLIDERIDW
jgi:hypothetical protein